MSLRAAASGIYSENAVPLELRSPRLAIAERIPVLNDPLTQVLDLLALCNDKLAVIGRSPREQACRVLRRYASTLELDSTDAVQVLNCLTDTDLAFEIPVTFMHGDFSIRNSGRDSVTRLFDWEWACPDGSILYDWWYLRHWVTWQVQLGFMDEQINHPIEGFVAKAINTLRISEAQLMQFGTGMHALYLMAKRKFKGHVQFETIRHGIERFRESVEHGRSCSPMTTSSAQRKAVTRSTSSI